MKLYHDLTQCRFLCRVNRFLAKCLLEEAEITVHVKNTGRLRELLVPGVLCWLERTSNPNRKTLYDLVAVEKDGRIVNIDSQAPNLIARAWVESGGWGEVTHVQSEFTWENSRFDLSYMQDGVRGLIEVKGVTLFDEQGMAVFPDAPTSRGAKHLHGLIRAAQSGMKAGVCFVIMKEDAVGLIPNDRTDPEFSAALRQAAQAGVRIAAAVCRVTADSAEIIRTVPVRL
ncbi:MAG: DNA/RNA nuclease SfsA [Clostridia bacterium]|nr:DNA/RNA nuclease SfsA [Clostridia bacterium]